MAEADRQRRRKAVIDAAGFTAVFEAMRDCRRPVIVHNGELAHLSDVCVMDVDTINMPLGTGRTHPIVLCFAH